MKLWFREEIKPAGAQSDRGGGQRRSTNSEGRNEKVMEIEMEWQGQGPTRVQHLQRAAPASAAHTQLQRAPSHPGVYV